MGEHLVPRPFLRRGTLGPARGGHRAGRRMQVRHGRPHLVHDGGGLQLGALRAQIALDAPGLLVHRAASTWTRQEL